MRSRKKFLDFDSIFLYNSVIQKYTFMLSDKEKPAMLAAYIIFGVCMYGCAQTAFSLGRRDGIEATVEHLVNAGLLEVEDE